MPSYNKANIEYAHIYADQVFTEEHSRSVEILKSKRERDYVQTILIDDYNNSANVLNIEKFLEWLGEQGATPDYFVFESALVPLATLLLERLPNEERSALEQHFRKIGKINCSFLVAVWQLVRLGALPLPFLRKLTPLDKSFIAERTITILPRIYERNEQRALGYIKLSPFADCLSKIEYVFF